MIAVFAFISLLIFSGRKSRRVNTAFSRDFIAKAHRRQFPAFCCGRAEMLQAPYLRRSLPDFPRDQNYATPSAGARHPLP
jgi:hypothetical protein